MCIRDSFEIEGAELIQEHDPDRKGIVFVSGHMGNWEVMGAVMGQLGAPVHAIYRPLDNLYLDRWMRDYRKSFSFFLVAKHGALPALIRAMRRGEHPGFLIDQHAGSTGTWIDFMGHPASTRLSAGALAKKFERPIIAGYTMRRRDPLKFAVRFELVARPDPQLDKDEDVLRMTEAINESFGRQIRSLPEQWLWMHRRWRPQTQETKSTVAIGRAS